MVYHCNKKRYTTGRIFDPEVHFDQSKKRSIIMAAVRKYEVVITPSSQVNVLAQRLAMAGATHGGIYDVVLDGPDIVPQGDTVYATNFFCRTMPIMQIEVVQPGDGTPINTRYAARLANRIFLPVGYAQRLAARIHLNGRINILSMNSLATDVEDDWFGENELLGYAGIHDLHEDMIPADVSEPVDVVATAMRQLMNPAEARRAGFAAGQRLRRSLSQSFMSLWTALPRL